jgi:hypothetical protein
MVPATELAKARERMKKGYEDSGVDFALKTE